IRERDERIAEARRRAEEDRKAVADVGHELGTIYGDAEELLRHARVVGLDEISNENDCNLNIPRYVDTFEPEPRVKVNDAINMLRSANKQLEATEASLLAVLKEARYETN